MSDKSFERSIAVIKSLRQKCAWLFLAIWVLPQAVQTKAAEAVFGTNGYIEYLAGGLPIIIGAPHGGTLKPAGIPDRKEGKVAQDSFTQELARLMREDMQKRFGAPPHLIICRLHRLKVDCNREIAEAAQGNAEAARAHGEFHDFIKQACNAAREKFGTGLYLDLHGHRHEEALVEVGQLIPGSKLAMSNDELDAGSLVSRQSSIRELDQRSPQSFSALLRGPQSLGGLLEARGFPSIPSPTHAAPTAGQLYFSGSYNIETHGSRDGGTVSALQIECPFKGVREKPELRAKFSAALCEALAEYMRVHFALELGRQGP